ncbi:MAG: cytochrome c biogenesis CcdA family protein, partial [Acidimicrobiia bacterium]|nr:cytochrome c biogenesis CcdA family protein [Acidimicrobiia bacterium]
MISASVALAFTAGMVATFNPCGFSLLPAYIGAFVAGDEVAQRTDQRVLRAVAVAAAVSLGFVVVFATVGLVIDSIASEARRQLPWVTIIIGGLLIAAGIATLAGWKPRLAVRGPQFSTASKTPTVMVGYGIAYAVASLSCTIGPFLAVTGTALDGSLIEGLTSYVAYALGMGVIILLLSIASALAHTTVAHHMRRLSRIAPRIGGGLMILAGGYAIWYGRWELAVYDGDLGTDPVIDTMEEVRLRLVDTIERIGAGRLTLLVALAVATAITLARLARGGPDTPPTTESLNPDSSKNTSTINQSST